MRFHLLLVPDLLLLNKLNLGFAKFTPVAQRHDYAKTKAHLLQGLIFCQHFNVHHKVLHKLFNKIYKNLFQPYLVYLLNSDVFFPVQVFPHRTSFSGYKREALKKQINYSTS